MKAVQGALIKKPYIEALFWDYASLFQKPPGGERTNEEQEAFDRSLDVMADVYASAVGTTALQLKEIPTRPTRFDGALCIFDPKWERKKKLRTIAHRPLPSSPSRPTLTRFPSKLPSPSLSSLSRKADTPNTNTEYCAGGLTMGKFFKYTRRTIP